MAAHVWRIDNNRLYEQVKYGEQTTADQMNWSCMKNKQQQNRSAGHLLRIYNNRLNGQ